MDPLIIECNIKFDNKKSLGMLIFTADTLYFFKKSVSALTVSSAVGGLLGALIGSLIDKRRAQKHPATFANDPEWNRFDESLRNRIKQMTSMKKVSKEHISRIVPTAMGFQFFTSSNEAVSFQGWIHKKKVAAWLTQNGFSVPNV